MPDPWPDRCAVYGLESQEGYAPETGETGSVPGEAAPRDRVGGGPRDGVAGGRPQSPDDAAGSLLEGDDALPPPNGNDTVNPSRKWSASVTLAEASAPSSTEELYR